MITIRKCGLYGLYSEGALKMREWKMREQIAGVENVGVIMRRNPSEEIGLR